MTTQILACCLAVVTANAIGDGHTPGITTAMGTAPVVGVTVAADTRFHPFGTRIWIEGLGWRTVEETGGKIKGPHRFDVFMATKDDALTWGRRSVAYRVLSTPYPSPTRNGRVGIMTLECSPTARALSQETPTPPDSATETATTLPVSTFTPTDEPTPSPLPTDTATATWTPRPTPTRTPSPTWTWPPWPTDTPEPPPTAFVTAIVEVTREVEVTRVVVVTATPGPPCMAELRAKIWLPHLLKKGGLHR